MLMVFPVFPCFTCQDFRLRLKSIKTHFRYKKKLSKLKGERRRVVIDRLIPEIAIKLRKMGFFLLTDEEKNKNSSQTQVNRFFFLPMIGGKHSIYQLK